MKKCLGLLFLVSILSFSSARGQAKFAFGIKYMGLSAHLQKSPHPQLYHNKLDKNGTLVWNHGLVLNFEYFLNEQLSIRASQALIFVDCANKFLGGSHIGLAYGYRFENSPHEARFSLGPIWFYRQSWKDLPGYKDTGLFTLSKNGKWQKKFVWHGAALQYNYWTENGYAYSLDVMPGIPELFTFAPGFRVVVSEQN